MRDGRVTTASGRPVIDLVIFDCDGVLVDSEHLAAEAMRDVLRASGVPAEIEHILPGIGMKQADIIAIVEKGVGRAIDPATLGDLWPETRRLFGERLAPTPGVDAFLNTLVTRRCVASSSYPERIAFSLETTGLAGYFAPDALFSSVEVPRGKPAPDLFLHAARRMGADPAQCLVIEDSPYGVMGAVAAGMTAIGYLGGCHATEAIARRLADAGAVFVAKDWDELARALGPYHLCPASDRLVGVTVKEDI